MTAPRWTIDDGGGLWWTNDDGWRTLLAAEVSTEISEVAYAALVEAVRDADTLTQARRLAAEYEAADANPSYRLALHRALLDLLAGDRP